MKNRYRADIKRSRDMKVCALLIVAFLVLVYSVSAREEMPQPDCAGCHVPDLGTYSKYRSYWKD